MTQYFPNLLCESHCFSVDRGITSNLNKGVTLYPPSGVVMATCKQYIFVYNTSLLHIVTPSFDEHNRARQF